MKVEHEGIMTRMTEHAHTHTHAHRVTLSQEKTRAMYIADGYKGHADCG